MPSMNVEISSAVDLAGVAHDAPVGEEQDAVGVARGDRVVRHHRDRLAVARARRGEQRRAPRGRCASRGCRWARRRTPGRAGSRAPARSRRAAADRPRARAVGGRCGRASPSTSTSSSIHSCSRAIGRRPSSSNGSMMLPRTSSVGTRLNDWNTNPMRRRRSTVSALSESSLISVSPSHARPDGRRVETGHDVHQGRLARSRRAHDGRELAAAQAERDVVECGDGSRAASVALAEFGDAGDEAEVGGLDLHAFDATDAPWPGHPTAGWFAVILWDDVDGHGVGFAAWSPNPARNCDIDQSALDAAAEKGLVHRRADRRRGRRTPLRARRGISRTVRCGCRTPRRPASPSRAAARPSPR